MPCMPESRCTESGRGATFLASVSRLVVDMGIDMGILPLCAAAERGVPMPVAPSVTPETTSNRNRSAAERIKVDIAGRKRGENIMAKFRPMEFVVYILCQVKYISAFPATRAIPDQAEVRTVYPARQR